MKVNIPPIKIQGIKSKLIPFISEHIVANDLWIEPFLGSGCVGFNLANINAIFSDINPHLINFYNDIKDDKINSKIVREYLEYEGLLLKQFDTEHYMNIRKRFNSNPNSLDFLFLNRAGFNGLIRFNKQLKYNVPYCHKNERFSKSYITKICNQVKYVEDKIKNNNWIFLNKDFSEVIKTYANENSLIYCDPPYIGRHVDYYDSWNEEDEILLHKCLIESKSKFILSTWNYNEYRSNTYLDSIWKDFKRNDIEHFYHVGASESNRKHMIETILKNY